MDKTERVHLRQIIKKHMLADFRNTQKQDQSNNQQYHRRSFDEARKPSSNTLKQHTLKKEVIRNKSSVDELESTQTGNVIKELENLIRERKDGTAKKQIPEASAKAKSRFRKNCVTINDIYDNKLASQPIVQKRCALHPAKLNRLYKKHKLSEEWRKKMSPKYCKSCLRKKWKSKVHKRPQTLFIYERKHRPGKFLSRTFCEKSKID